MIRLLLLLTALFAADAVPLAAAEEPVDADRARPADHQRAVVIPVQGMITPWTGAFLDRKLDEAESRGADLVVLHIDSPGGYLSTTLEITTRLRQIEWAKTVAYIDHEALSGAAIIALATDRIVMAPRARIGDAGPIVMGDDAAFRHAPEKIRSDLVQRLRDLAEATGRPPALAEAMADARAVVFEATEIESGRRAYFTEQEWQSLPDAERWERGKPVFETREGNFLTVNGLRAAALGLAEDTAEDLDAVLRAHGVPPSEVTRLDGSWVDTTVWVLNWPLVTILLLVLGVVALVIEFSAPGLSFGGLLSLLCFGLFFWSRFLGGTAGWLEVILFACGLIFIAAELFLIPGFGVAGIGGALLVFVSLVMASQHAWLPESTRDLRQLGESVLAVLAAGVVLTALAVLGSRHLGRLPLFRQLTLAPPELAVNPASEPLAPQATDGDSFAPAVDRLDVGEVGVAASPLRPAGKVQFGAELVDVVTEGDFIEAGRSVRILQKQGTRVVVRAV